MQARKYDTNSVGKQSDGEKQGTKNRHLMVVNQLRKREDEWNGRFYIENIPDYHFTSDKHCETYKQLILEKTRVGKRSPTREGVNAPRSDDKVIFAPGKIRKKPGESNPMYLYAEGQQNRPESIEPITKINSQGKPPQYQIREKTREGQVRPKSMNKRIYISESHGGEQFNEEIRALEAEINALWEMHNIPQFHRELFLKSLGSGKPKAVIEIFRKEIEDLNQNHSMIQNASRAVLARENCLKHLREVIKNIADAENSEQGALDEVVGKASELLTHLRILSLNAVECIVKWRELIQNIYYLSRGVVKPTQPASIPFWYYGVNYLLKMKNDSKDFVATSLAKYFNFSSKSDPFLVYPSKELDEGEGSQKTVLYISKALINRIRASEMVILEESVNENMSEKRIFDSQSSLDTHLRSPAESDAKKSYQYRSPANKDENRKQVYPPGMIDSQKQKVPQQQKDAPKTKETSALRRKFSFKNENLPDAEANSAGLPNQEEYKDDFSPSQSELSDKKEITKALNPDSEGTDLLKVNRTVSGNAGRPPAKMGQSGSKQPEADQKVRKRPNIPIVSNQRVQVRKEADKQPVNRLNADRVPIRATALQQNEKETNKPIQNNTNALKQPEKTPMKDIIDNPAIKESDKPIKNETVLQKQAEKLPPKEQDKKVTNEPEKAVAKESDKSPSTKAAQLNEKSATQEVSKPTQKQDNKKAEDQEVAEKPVAKDKETTKSLPVEKVIEEEKPVIEEEKNVIEEEKPVIEEEKPIKEPVNESKKEAIKEQIEEDITPPTKQVIKEQTKEVEKPAEEKSIEKKPEPKVEEKVTKQPEDASPEELKLIPLEAFETEIGDIFSSHSEQVESILRQSFNSSIDDIIQISNSGQDARWIEITKGAQHLGLAAANINGSNFTVRRLQLLYFTVTELELYEEALSLLVNYFWKKDPCDDIWVGLIHMEDETGKLGVNKKVEEAYKKNGFRWKRITNDSDSGTRKTEYAAKRPEGVVSETKLTEEISIKEAITLTDASLVKVAKPSGLYVDNRFCTISALLNHCEERLTQFNTDDNSTIQGYLNLIGESQASNPEGWLKYGIIFDKKSSINEIKELSRTKLQSDTYLPASSEQEGKFSCCLMSLIYRWMSFNVGTLDIGGRKVSCLRINNTGNEMISMNSRYCNTKVYLLPTDDKDVNIFIADNAELIEKIQAEKDSFQSIISSLFKKLGRDQDTVNQDIWLPCFALKAENQELPEVPTAFKDEYKVSNGVATYTIQVGANKTSEGILKIVPAEEAITFNKSFVFGVTHSKLDVPLFALLVKEDYFLSASS